MLRALKRAFTRPDPGLSAQIERRGPGWLAQALAGFDDLPVPPEGSAIEERARLTEALGPQPLWTGYRDLDGYAASTTAMRSSREVRSDARMGRFYAWLAAGRQPEVIVEFGTAFGISGMYWLAGLRAAGGGTLLTFEPNESWAAIAAKNLGAISDRFILTVGTFEDNVERVLTGRSIDIGFIDAIHTGDFVRSQYAIVRRYLRPGSLVLFDDINFSEDMDACWAELSAGSEVATSARIGNRLGIIEIAA